MDRVSKMRFRESNLDTPPELESEALSLSPSPPPRVSFNLSSMVVKPSASDGGGSDLEIGYTSDEHLPPRRRLDSLHDPFRRVDSLEDPLRRDSPSAGRRRGSSSPLHRRRWPDGFNRRVSQTVLHRRGSPIGVHRRGSPLAFHPRPQRLRNDQGYMQRPDSISPQRRLRADDGYYEPDFGQRSGRGMRGRGGRFRDISPTFGRGIRPYTRGFDSSTHAISPSEGEFVHRNDPNLSPREGDWICQNPSCGNLNFARRTYCNNCHKFRFDEPYGSSHSPHKGYASPLPHRSFSPNLPVSPIHRGQRREFNGYRSPPPLRGWNPDDPREFNMNLIPPKRGRKFFDHISRGRIEFHKDNFRERGRSDRSAGSNWERRGLDTFIPESRVNRRHVSPHDRSIQDARDRSRSPIGYRLPRGSFAGRRRDDRHYDGPYGRNRRADDLDAAPGRGYRVGGARGRRADHVF